MKQTLPLQLVRVLGDNPATNTPYWLGTDGNVYYGRRVSESVNEGPEKEFMDRVKAGKYRFKANV